MNYRLTELKVLLFLLLLSAVSCQRPMYDEEDDEDGVSQTNLPLKISARSSGESQINYPAYIYAFAEDGSCSASLKMTDNAQIEMKLPPARYTIVAIAGLGDYLSTDSSSVTSIFPETLIFLGAHKKIFGPIVCISPSIA